MIPSLFRHSLLGLSILAGSSGAGAAESPDAVFDRYVAAVHAGDMATVRALIAPDEMTFAFVKGRAFAPQGATLE